MPASPAAVVILARIGARIRTARGQRLVADLARQLGVRPNTWSRWEAGAFLPAIDKWERLADLLDVEWSDLFDPRFRDGD